MFEINNKNQLVQFLKIVSEEAVKNSQKILLEKNDPLAYNFQSALSKEKSSLYEAEDEDAEETEKNDEAEADVEKDEAETETQDDSSDNPAADAALALGNYDENTGASLDSVIKALNTLRAGRSTKDKEIQTELGDYYDRLDENEREVLLLFLKELSKILTGALDGDNAQDPSDPKTYFNITKREKEEDQSGTKITKQKQATQQTQPQASQQRSAGPEDTSPPIKVNESQDLTLLREKIKLIMEN